MTASIRIDIHNTFVQRVAWETGHRQINIINGQLQRKLVTWVINRSFVIRIHSAIVVIAGVIPPLAGGCAITTFFV